MGGAHNCSCRLLWPVLLSMLALQTAVGRAAAMTQGPPLAGHWASLAAADNRAGLTHDAHRRVLLHFLIDGLSEGFPHQLLFFLCHCHYIELPVALPWPCSGSSGAAGPGTGRVKCALQISTGHMAAFIDADHAGLLMSGTARSPHASLCCNLAPADLDPWKPSLGEWHPQPCMLELQSWARSTDSQS